jgi:hypothetical protein
MDGLTLSGGKKYVTDNTVHISGQISMELNLCFKSAFVLAFRTLDFSVEDFVFCL